MADFDPKAFLAQNKKETFDPKAFLNQQLATEPVVGSEASFEGIPLKDPSSMNESSKGDIMRDVAYAPLRFGLSLAKPVVGAAEWAGISAPSKAVLEMDKRLAEGAGPISSAASFAGDVVGFGKLGMLASKALPAAMKVPGWAKPILGGATAGAIQPTGKAVGEEGFMPEKATDIGLGAALGPVAEKVVKGAGNILSPQLQRLKELTAQGIDTSKLTLGQILGGKTQGFENLLQSVPFGGVKPLVKAGEKSLTEQANKRADNFDLLLDQFKDKNKKEITQNFEAARFNLEKEGLASSEKLNQYIDMMQKGLASKNADFSRPIFNSVLSNIGQKLPSDVKGNDAIRFTQDAISKGYDDALKKIDKVEITPVHLKELNDLLERAKSEFGDASPALFKQLQTDINKKMLGNFKESSSIPSNQWHTVFKEIGAKSFGKREATGFEREYGKSLYEAQKIWSRLAEEADPTGTIKKVNTAHSELQIPQRAAAYVSGVKLRGGAFTPEELLSASAKESSEKAFAAGRAPYQAQAKKSIDMMQAAKEDLDSKIAGLTGSKNKAQQDKLVKLTEERNVLTDNMANLQSKLEKRVGAKKESLGQTIGEIKEKGKPMHPLAGTASMAVPLAPAVIRGLSQAEGPTIPNVMAQLGNLGPAYYGLLAAPTVATRGLYGNPLAQSLLKKAATERPEFMTKAGEALKQQPNASMLGGTEAVQQPVKQFIEQTQSIGQKEGGLVSLQNK
jgi:hypothetical protein